MSTPAKKMPYTTQDIYNLAFDGKAIPVEFVNIQNRDGETALHLAIEPEGVDAIHALQALLAAGADLYAKNNDGDTPLHRAALRGNLDAIRPLLLAGADPNAKNKDGETPLYLAAWRGSSHVIQTLLTAGADPNAKNKDGETPLHRAALRRNLDPIQAFVAAGAGLWEDALSKIHNQLNALKNSLLTTPQEHSHLNFNNFPPERIDEIETCLETLARELASEYEKPFPNPTPLKSVCLAGLPLTERCVNALARIITISPNIITRLDLSPQFAQHNSSVGEMRLDLSGQSIQPGSPAGNLLEFLLASRKLAQLILLNPDFTEADIHHLNSLCLRQRWYTDLPKLYLMGTPSALKALAEADHNLRLATHLVTKGGVVCPQVPSLSSLIGTKLHSFFAPPKTVAVSSEATATSCASLSDSPVPQQGSNRKP